MTTTPTPEQGARVRIVARLGLTADPAGDRFVDDVAEPGTEARYLGPHSNPALESWHVLEVDLEDGRTVYAPAHPAHFEPLT